RRDISLLGPSSRFKLLVSQRPQVSPFVMSHGASSVLPEIALCRRRVEDGPGDRTVGPPRGAADHGAFQAQALAGNGHEYVAEPRGGPRPQWPGESRDRAHGRRADPWTVLSETRRRGGGHPGLSPRLRPRSSG